MKIKLNSLNSFKYIFLNAAEVANIKNENGFENLHRIVEQFLNLQHNSRAIFRLYFLENKKNLIRISSPEDLDIAIKCPDNAELLELYTLITRLSEMCHTDFENTGNNNTDDNNKNNNNINNNNCTKCKVTVAYGCLFACMHCESPRVQLCQECFEDETEHAIQSYKSLANSPSVKYPEYDLRAKCAICKHPMTLIRNSNYVTVNTRLYSYINSHNMLRNKKLDGRARIVQSMNKQPTTSNPARPSSSSSSSSSCPVVQPMTCPLSNDADLLQYKRTLCTMMQAYLGNEGVLVRDLLDQDAEEVEAQLEESNEQKNTIDDKQDWVKVPLEREISTEK